MLVKYPTSFTMIYYSTNPDFEPHQYVPSSHLCFTIKQSVCEHVCRGDLFICKVFSLPFQNPYSILILHAVTTAAILLCSLVRYVFGRQGAAA